MSLELGMNILRRGKDSQQHCYFKLEPDLSLNKNSLILSTLKNVILDTTQSTSKSMERLYINRNQS